MFLDGLDQRLFPYRLGDMGGAASVLSSLGLLFYCVGGQSNDGGRTYPLLLLPLSNGLGGRVSVHDRHLDVHEYQIVFVRLELAHGDFETIRISGHSMKGAGGGYGFDGITDIGQYLEQAAKEQNSEMVRKQVECLADYLERVEVVCE